jgi:hypothetical protein
MTKNNRNAPKKKRFTHKKRNTNGGHKKRNSKKRLKRLKKGGHAWDDPELQWFNAYKNSHKFLLKSLEQTENEKTKLIVYETKKDLAGNSIYIGAIKGQSSASMEDTGLEKPDAEPTNGGMVNAVDAGSAAANEAYIKNYVFLESPTPKNLSDSTTPLFTRTTSYTQAIEETELTKANYYYDTLDDDERKYKNITEPKFYDYRLELINKFHHKGSKLLVKLNNIIAQLNDIYTKKNNVLYFSPNQGEVCDTKCVSMESCPYLKLYADTVTIPEHFDTEITTILKKYNNELEEYKEPTKDVLEGDVKLIKELLKDFDTILEIDSLQSYLTHIPTFSMSILPGLSFLELMKYKLQYYGIIVIKDDDTTDFLNCMNDRHMLPSILIKVFRSVPKYFLELLLYNILFDFLNYIDSRDTPDDEDKLLFKKIIELYTSKPKNDNFLTDMVFDDVSNLKDIQILQTIFQSKDISLQFEKDEEKHLTQLDTSDKLKLWECAKAVGGGGMDEIIDDYNNYLNPLYLTNMETDDRTKLEIRIREHNITICDWAKSYTQPS